MALTLLATQSPPTPENPAPSHRVIVKAMAAYAKPDMVKGSALFLVDFALYWTAILAVLFAPNLGLKLLASVFAGIKLANLATLAHDAAHNSLTPSRRLNWWLGVLAFMPCLFNYRLWVYDHHVLHHPHTNGDHVDSYKPLSKKEYDALPALGKWWYRFSRSSNPLAFGTYYIIQRWWQVKFMPRAFLPEERRRSAWCHFAFLCAYAVAFFAFLLAAPGFAPVSAATALLLAFVLPFFVFQSLLAFSLYVNHTHPEIPWFEAGSSMKSKISPEALTVHLKFPAWMAHLAHNFYDHAAHHVYPAIPCYELGRAQARLNELLGADALVVGFSFRTLGTIYSKCKLYDYTHFQWLDFDGKPTTEAPRIVLQHLIPSPNHSIA